MYADRPPRDLPPSEASGETTRTLPLTDERLGLLLQALRPRLLAVALRFTHDRDVADDVVQSAFEKAIRHRARFRGEARVSTWLHRIVANEALMWLRAERRRSRRLVPAAQEDLERLADPEPDVASRLERRRRGRRLREGIAALGNDERHVIERCVLPGRTYAEYARENGLHPAAAKSRAFRARRRLHDLVAE